MKARRSPGRLVGTVLTYGERASDRAEIFETGALTWPEGGVTLNRQHQRGAPIMRVTPEVRGDAIVIDVLLAGHVGRPGRSGRGPGRAVQGP